MEIKFSQKEERDIKYFLSLRYGKRKDLKALIKIAIQEIIARQAKDELVDVLK